MKGTSTFTSCVFSIAIAIALLFTTTAQAASMGSRITNTDSIDRETGQRRVTGFIEIEPGRYLYADVLFPAPGKPWAAEFNGLTYRTESWDSFTSELKGDGLGIIRWDMEGMGHTLVRNGIPTDAIQATNQARDFGLLLKALDVRSKVHLVTLSYGAAIATLYASQNPSRVASLILQGPLTRALESQDRQIKSQVAWHNQLYPWDRRGYDELYDMYLKINVYSTYGIAEPIVYEHPYKLEATFRMVQGVRRYVAADHLAKLPAGVVHLVVGTKDEYVPASETDQLWRDLPERTKGSRIFLKDVRHKIPEEIPVFSADLVKLLIAGDSRLSGGTTWTGYFWANRFESEDGQILKLKSDGTPVVPDKKEKSRTRGPAGTSAGTCEALFEAM